MELLKQTMLETMWKKAKCMEDGHSLHAVTQALATFAWREAMVTTRGILKEMAERRGEYFEVHGNGYGILTILGEEVYFALTHEDEVWYPSQPSWWAEILTNTQTDDVSPAPVPGLVIRGAFSGDASEQMAKARARLEGGIALHITQLSLDQLQQVCKTFGVDEQGIKDGMLIDWYVALPG